MVIQRVSPVKMKSTAGRGMSRGREAGWELALEGLELGKVLEGGCRASKIGDQFLCNSGNSD